MSRPSRRTSNIWTLSKSELQEVVDRSSTLSEVLTNLGHNAITGGSYRRMMQRFKEDDIDLSELRLRAETRRLASLAAMRRITRIPDERIFCENSTYTSVRPLVISRKLIPYTCALCPNDGNHNGRPLSLHLDHVNGTNNDNRLNNLRWLCPNCHSQTPTYAGKRRKVIHQCEKCGGKRCKASKSKLCVSCRPPGFAAGNFKITWPSTAEMAAMVQVEPTSTISKRIGVSDVAVAKFCKRNNIEKPGRGHWAKQQSLQTPAVAQ